MLTIEDVVFAVLFSVVLVFNIAGNSLVIYIITNERGMKTSTNYLLFNLAVADLLFGVFLAPKYIILLVLDYPFLPDGVLGDWLCKLVFAGNIAWMASRASVFTMLCLSVERYFAVCRPHTFSQRFSPKIVKVLVVVSWMYAAVIASPLFVYAQLKRVDSSCDISRTTFLKGHTIFIMIESVCFLLLMVFFFVKICISLWCKQTVEPTGEREITERKKKKKVTYCVLAVLVTFVVCWIPFYISYLIYGFSSKKDIPYMIIVITTVNAAVDPFLFSFQSFRFKAFINKILCCRKESP